MTNQENPKTLRNYSYVDAVLTEDKQVFLCIRPLFVSFSRISRSETIKQHSSYYFQGYPIEVRKRVASRFQRYITKTEYEPPQITRNTLRDIRFRSLVESVELLQQLLPL